LLPGVWPILNGWDPYCEVYKVVFARAEAHGQEILRHCSVPVGEVLGVELNGASPSAAACAP